MSIPEAVRTLRAPATIRKRCDHILAAGLAGKLAHFSVDLAKLDEAARITAEVTRTRYPDLNIPPHSRFAHFEAGGVPRLAELTRELSSRDPREQARALIDVVVTSVLLDAGAGDAWRYHEPGTDLSIGRSEGLAVASLAWVRAGGLSAAGRPYEVDADGLCAVTEDTLRAAFQVRADNPLVGLAGRVHLLRALGETLRARPDVFGSAPRLGNLIDRLVEEAPGGDLPAAAILSLLLDALASIWPGRIRCEGVPLGDVWVHPHAGGEGATAGLVPFHKLSQWLSYSLLHPIAVAGLRVRDLDALTGLAEYRNGGLFLDAGVLVPRDPQVLARAHLADSELVVEWRALTVALLDRIAPLVAGRLGVPLSLASVLEGGTWAAGRALAAERRTGGGPPLRIDSDGTVF